MVTSLPKPQAIKARGLRALGIVRCRKNPAGHYLKSSNPVTYVDFSGPGCELFYGREC
jgi:hypothetical protein